jgi:uncharacterized protein (TIGR03067 family)
MKHALFALLLVIVPAPAGDAPKEQTDEEKLQGEWIMTKLEVREESVPAEKLTGTTLLIKKDQYITVVKKKEYPTKFKLDPKQDPKHIDMWLAQDGGEPQLSKGIYSIEKDKLVICRGQAAGGERPRNFVSSAANDHFVVTWERKAKP